MAGIKKVYKRPPSMVRSTRPDKMHGVRFDGEWPKFTPFVDKLWDSVIAKLDRIASARIITNVFSRINRVQKWKEVWHKTRDQKILVQSALVAQIGARPTSNIVSAIGLDSIDAPGLVVVMTRYGVEYIDSDNLESGFKGIRDTVAEWLTINDADFRVSWVCRQRESGEDKEERLPVVDISFYVEPKLYDVASYVVVASATRAKTSDNAVILAADAHLEANEIKRKQLRDETQRARSKRKKSPKTAAVQKPKAETEQKTVVDKPVSADRSSWADGGDWGNETKDRIANGETLWDIILSNARKI